MPALPDALEETAGEVPRRPLREMTLVAGARQMGCVAVAEGVAARVADGEGLPELESETVAEEVAVRVADGEGVPVLESVWEALGVPVQVDEELGVVVEERVKKKLDKPLELRVAEELLELLRTRVAEEVPVWDCATEVLGALSQKLLALIDVHNVPGCVALSQLTVRCS